MLTSFNKFFETGKFSLHSYSVHSSSSSESEPERRPKKRKQGSSSDVATSSSNEELVESGSPPPASPTVPDVSTSQPGPSQPTVTPPVEPAPEAEIPGRRDDDVEGTTPTSDWNFGLKKYCTNINMLSIRLGLRNE